MLTYLKGTIDFGHIYGKGVKDLNVISYRKSEFAGDVEDRKSTLGCVFFLGGLLITWNSLKQKVEALSSCEAEYIAITSAVCPGVWGTRLVKEVMGVELEAVKIMVAKQSVNMLSKTLADHNRTKHIDTCYHFIRDCVEDGRAVIEHVKTEDQLTYILIKSLERVKFVELSARIGVKKVWDVKKIKEENVGADFYSSGEAGACGAAVALKGERPTRTSEATLVGTVAPTRMVPRDAQWGAERFFSFVA